MSPLTRTLVSTAALAGATRALTPCLHAANTLPPVPRANYVDDGPILSLLFVLEEASQQLGPFGGGQCAYLVCQLLKVCLGARHDALSVARVGR
jgi:hypothetical protein